MAASQQGQPLGQARRKLHLKVSYKFGKKGDGYAKGYPTGMEAAVAYGEIPLNLGLDSIFKVCTPSQCSGDHISDGSDIHHPRCLPI